MTRTALPRPPVAWGAQLQVKPAPPRPFMMLGLWDLPPISSLAFKLERMERGYDLTGEEGRTEFAKAAAVLLKTVADPVVLENHLKALAIKTGFSRDVLLAQVGVRQRSQADPINVRVRHAPNRPAREATDDSAAEKTLRKDCTRWTIIRGVL